MKEIIAELMEDYADMCGFVGAIDFASFWDGYMAYEAWSQTQDDEALLLAS